MSTKWIGAALRARAAKRIAASLGASLAIIGVFAAGASGHPDSNAALSSVTMVVSGNFIAYGPYYIAVQNGYFAAEGLDLKVSSVSSGPVAAAAVLSGDAQFAMGTTVQYLPVIAQGLGIKLVVPITNQLQTASVMSKSFAAAHNLTPNSPLRTKVQALKGATVGVTSVGGAIDQTFRVVLVQNGVDPQDVHIVAVGTDPAAWSGAITRGRIDVAVSGVPIPEFLSSTGDAIPFVTISKGQAPRLSGVLDEAFAMNASWAKTHRPEVLAFIRAITRAQQFIKKSPAQARDIMWKAGFATLPQAAFNLAWDDLVGAFYDTPVVRPVDYKRALLFVGYNLNKTLDIPLKTAFAVSEAKQVALQFGLIKPAVLTRARLLGRPAIGKVIRVKLPTWNYRPTRIQYKWLRCGRSCTAIAHQTRPTLKLTAAYSGSAVKAIVTATLRGKAVASQTGEISVKK